MKIAVLGGTFNPLHIGHCMLADSVCKDLHYDKVLFVPTFIPPHKQVNDAISIEDRVGMLESFCNSSCVNGKSEFELELCEIERGGVSYTYDTLQFIVSKYKNIIEGKPGFILGEESALQFKKWYRWNEILDIADLIIAKREKGSGNLNVESFKNKPSGKFQDDFYEEDALINIDFPYKALNNPVLTVSSTEIRARIANHKAFRYLVPDSVFHYIIEHKLYGYTDE